jgi:hypothetical protein
MSLYLGSVIGLRERSIVLYFVVWCLGDTLCVNLVAGFLQRNRGRVSEVLGIPPGWVLQYGNGDPVIFGWTVEYLSEDLVLCVWRVWAAVFPRGGGSVEYPLHLRADGRSFIYWGAMNLKVISCRSCFQSSKLKIHCKAEI